MRIHMYGGALTMSYSIAKCLKKLGQDVILFVDKKARDKSYMPEWEDDSLNSEYPEWIKVTDARFDRVLLGDKNSRAFARLLSDCDMLHLHGEAYLWANIFNKSFLYHSYGYDLDQMPFKRDSIKSAVVAYLSRRGIRRAGKILIAPHQRIFLERLRVADRGVYAPFPVDTDKYKDIDASELKKKILMDNKADLVFFHPTRHEWVNNRDTNNKANDKVLRAFALYLERSSSKAILMMVNKGRDAAATGRLAADLGIRDKVVWLEPMPKRTLIKHYCASDIVLDQFSLGSFGQIFLESMACGRPTFIYLKGYERLYSEPPPAVNVFTVDEIAENLIDLSKDREMLEEMGRRSRAWLQRYHGWQNACEKFVELYKTLMTEPDRC